jgi:hypothetical protein
MAWSLSTAGRLHPASQLVAATAVQPKNAIAPNTLSKIPAQNFGLV